MLRTASVLLMIAAAGSAQAAYLSFASDSNGNAPTFHRGANTLGINDARALDPDGAVVVDLMLDGDEDGPLPGLLAPVRFEFAGAMSNYTVTNIAGRILHSYTVAGSFTFAGAMDPTAFVTVTFQNAVFSSWSDSVDLWGSSATIQSNAFADTLVASGPNSAGAIVQDFAYTLTNLRALPGTGSPNGRVAVGQGGVTRYDWASEGSFSATVTVVPAPSAVALLGLGGLVAGRRRR